MQKHLLLTGRPGVGKSTVLLRTVDMLRSAGVVVGGMTTGEIRVRGVRTGFEIVDLFSLHRGVLATTDRIAGPQLGRYFVNLEDLTRIGVNAVSNAILDVRVQVIAIDEIGPMELMSDRFDEVVSEAFDSGKIVLATVHERASHPVLYSLKKRGDVSILVVDVGNRADAHLYAYEFVASKLHRIP